LKSGITVAAMAIGSFGGEGASGARGGGAGAGVGIARIAASALGDAATWSSALEELGALSDGAGDGGGAGAASTRAAMGGLETANGIVITASFA
jgi:hypothetical protein